jgi:hypothetical protein
MGRINSSLTFFGRSTAIDPSQLAFLLELLVKVVQGIVEAAGTENLALTTVSNSSPPRPCLIISRIWIPKKLDKLLTDV